MRGILQFFFTTTQQYRVRSHSLTKLSVLPNLKTNPKDLLKLGRILQLNGQFLKPVLKTTVAGLDVCHAIFLTFVARLFFTSSRAGYCRVPPSQNSVSGQECLSESRWRESQWVQEEKMTALAQNWFLEMKYWVVSCTRGGDASVCQPSVWLCQGCWWGSVSASVCRHVRVHSPSSLPLPATHTRSVCFSILFPSSVFSQFYFIDLHLALGLPRSLEADRRVCTFSFE